MRKEGQSLEARNAEITAAQRILETLLAQGKVKVVLAPNGAVGFSGWTKEDRKDLSDVCTVRSMMAQGSQALRSAIQAEERRTGKRANLQATAQGHHTHDNGKTWSKH